MAQHFLLPCECGAVNEVSATQAGGRIACPCGRSNQVPSLAGLRRLSPVESPEAAARPKSGRRWRGASLAIGLVVVLCGGTALGLSFWNGHHFRAAQQACEQRDFRQADDHLQQRFTLGLANLPADVLAVQIARRSGNLEEAGKRLQHCQRWHGDEPSIALEQRLLKAQQGDLREAKELLAAYAASSDQPEAPLVLEACIIGSLQQLTVAYTQNQAYQGSEAAQQLPEIRRAIEQWLRLRPQQADQVQGLVWRYQAHLFGHELAQARLELDRALELDPKHREARMMLGIHLAQESPAEAAAVLQELHEEAPDDVRTSLSLAGLRRRLGELAEARTLLDNVLAKDDANVDARIGLGRIAQDQQDLASAEDWFRSAHREDPKSAEAILALSRCLRAAGKTKEAARFQDQFDQMWAERTRQAETAGHPNRR